MFKTSKRQDFLCRFNKFISLLSQIKKDETKSENEQTTRSIDEKEPSILSKRKHRQGICNFKRFKECIRGTQLLIVVFFFSFRRLTFTLFVELTQVKICRGSWERNQRHRTDLVTSIFSLSRSFQNHRLVN